MDSKVPVGEDEKIKKVVSAGDIIEKRYQDREITMTIKWSTLEAAIYALEVEAVKHTEDRTDITQRQFTVYLYEAAKELYGQRDSNRL